MEKKLYRDDLNKKIGGVCAGLADYLNIDVTIIRVIFVIATIMKGVGVIPYLVLWIVLPKRPYFIDPNIKVDYTVPPNGPYNPFANTGNPFTANSASNPYSGGPQAPFAPKKSSTGAGVIIGVALVVFGSYFLLDEFNILPDLDLHRLWPLGLVLAGIAVIFSGRKQPWDKYDWNKAGAEEANVVTEEKTELKTEEKPADDKAPNV